MALHDFRCPGCGLVARDVYVSVELGARQAAIYCPACDDWDVGVRMEWIPAIGRMDFGPAGGAGFKAFTIEEVDQRGNPQRIEVDSVHKLRALERESEQRARNGEGRPLVWRDYAQDRSNRDVHTLATSDQLGDPHGCRQVIASAKAKIEARRGETVTKQHGTV